MTNEPIRPDSRPESEPESLTGPPRWVKIAVIAVGILIVIVVAAMLLTGASTARPGMDSAWMRRPRPQMLCRAARPRSWAGAVGVFVVLDIAALTSADPQLGRVLWLALQATAWFLRPFGLRVQAGRPLKAACRAGRPDLAASVGTIGTFIPLHH